MDKLKIRREEVWRYLGTASLPHDSALARKIEEACEKLDQIAAPRWTSLRLPLSFEKDGVLFIGEQRYISHDLTRHLHHCREVFLFAATLGIGVDQWIRRSEITDMSMAVILQACAAEAIESWCDRCEESLLQEARKNDLYLRPRYSPGYGDFSIEYQSQLLRTLQAEKKIGMTVTESCLMLPMKSVSAVIGLTSNQESCHVHKCAACSNTTCPFRKV